LYNRPEVAAVPRDLVPPHKNKKINKFMATFLRSGKFYLIAFQKLTPELIL
jgi:hypothetical protein